VPETVPVDVPPIVNQAPLAEKEYLSLEEEHELDQILGNQDGYAIDKMITDIDDADQDDKEPEKKKRGPTKSLSPAKIEIQQQIVLGLCQGLSLMAAVQSAGVSYRVFAYYIKRVKKERDPLGLIFIERLRMAEDGGKNYLEQILLRHGKKSWQAVAHILERRFPGTWGPKPQNQKIETEKRPLKILFEEVEADYKGLEGESDAVPASGASVVQDIQPGTGTGSGDEGAEADRSQSETDKKVHAVLGEGEG
jgi:hypothetical protein